jgi:FixJ family two-component response regulator
MNVATPKVIVIDDDASVRRSLARLLKTEGHNVECFVSAEAYLMEVEPSGEAACLVLDINMPGLNGLDFQQVQLERGCGDQIIFITGHGDVPMCARAMKAGAVDFLPKPFSDAELLEAVDRALHRAQIHGVRRIRRAQKLRPEEHRERLQVQVAQSAPGVVRQRCHSLRHDQRPVHAWHGGLKFATNEAKLFRIFIPKRK